MTKATILYFGPGLFIALLISKYRKHLLTPWPWLGLGLFLIAISPYLLWEQFNHWPTLEFWSHYSANNLYPASISEYFVNIILRMNPLLFPLLLFGLYRLFRRIGDTHYYFLGLMFLITLVLLFNLHARMFMMVALFIPLIAAGAVFIEEKLSGFAWRNGLQVAVIGYLIAGGILVAPSALPILPVEVLPVYAKSFGFLYQPIKDFNYPKTDIPEEFSNRIGWEDMVKAVAKVYRELPLEDREKVGIWADWNGPAGAIDLYGPQYGLPHAVSGYMTYYLWGPGYSWEVMILVTAVGPKLAGFFGDMQLKEVISNDYAMPFNHLSVYVCRQPTMSAERIWSYLKNY